MICQRIHTQPLPNACIIVSGAKVIQTGMFVALFARKTFLSGIGIA
jgi:hypothetical protein